jgi:hypothetical protein
MVLLVKPQKERRAMLPDTGGSVPCYKVVENLEKLFCFSENHRE